MKFIGITSLLLWVAFQSDAVAAAADDVLGTWVTQGGESRIEIYRCQNAYCGKIAWLLNPTYPKDDAGGMAGLTKIDRENSNASQRMRPLLGLEMLNGFSYAGDGVWENGQIYDPKNGKTYSCRMTLLGNQLQVRGYIGFSLLGRTTTWTRL